MGILRQGGFGFAQVERSQGTMHMWHGDTSIRYLEKGELAQRRRELGLEVTDGVELLVTADDAAAHRDEKHATLRKVWEEVNACIFLGCDRQHLVQVPAGFVAAGAPNDQNKAQIPQTNIQRLRLVVAAKTKSTAMKFAWTRMPSTGPRPFHACRRLNSRGHNFRSSDGC